MSPNQFEQLMHYLITKHPELFAKFPNNIYLHDDGKCAVGKPATVSDQDYKELQEIISKWRDQNNAR
jgi:hypothetical protein